MRIIDPVEEIASEEPSVLPEVEKKPEKSEKSTTIQEDLFNVAQELFNIGNTLNKLATKL